MSTFEIKMPKLGESITEGTIISWSVKVGDTIEEDDVLFEVNTAKVSAEVPSPVSGKIVQILHNEGDVVPVGNVVAIVEIEGSESNDAPVATAPASAPAAQPQASASSAFDIKMPKLGESITEGTIVSWSVKVGDTIEEDDVLFEVNTAKVSAEVPSPVSGVLIEILHGEGEIVPVGNVVARVAVEGGEVVSTPVAASASTAPTAVTTAPSTSKPANREEARWYSPVVKSLAKEANISDAELEQIKGTGYQGRVTKDNIKDYIMSKKSGVTPQPAAPKANKAAVASAPQQAPASKPATKSAIKSLPGDQTIPMDAIGRVISDRMVESVHTSPHVTTIVEVDVTKLVNWRSKNKDAFKKREGISLTYMPAIVQATTKALQKHPKINAAIDGYNYILRKQINMGIAVSLPDDNLIVPVIRETDKMSLSGLAVELDNVAKKARSNKLGANDISGSTFTISNFGSFKNLFATPIINQPEVAILGVGFIEKKPAVVSTPEGDVIAIRSKMYLSLSYDHRLINGAVGGAFLKDIADYLENWDTKEI